MRRSLMMAGLVSAVSIAGLFAGPPTAVAFEDDDSLLDEQLVGYEEAFAAAPDAGKALRAVRKARKRLTFTGNSSVAYAKAFAKIVKDLGPAIARDDTLGEQLDVFADRLTFAIFAELDGVAVAAQQLEPGPVQSRATRLAETAGKRLVGSAHPRRVRAAAAIAQAMVKNRAAQLLIAPAVAQAPWFQDADLDSFGDADHRILTPVRPQGYVALGTDCDDVDPTVNPGETDDNGDEIDSDCDGDIDEDT